MHGQESWLHKWSACVSERQIAVTHELSYDFYGSHVELLLCPYERLKRDHQKSLASLLSIPRLLVLIWICLSKHSS